jgi:hypothetical protein
MAAPQEHDTLKWVSMIVDLVYRPLLSALYLGLTMLVLPEARPAVY